VSQCGTDKKGRVDRCASRERHTHRSWRLSASDRQQNHAVRIKKKDLKKEGTFYQLYVTDFEPLKGVGARETRDQGKNVTVG